MNSVICVAIYNIRIAFDEIGSKRFQFSMMVLYYTTINKYIVITSHNTFTTIIYYPFTTNTHKASMTKKPSPFGSWFGWSSGMAAQPCLPDPSQASASCPQYLKRLRAKFNGDDVRRVDSVLGTTPKDSLRTNTEIIWFIEVLDPLLFTEEDTHVMRNLSIFKKYSYYNRFTTNPLLWHSRLNVPKSDPKAPLANAVSPISNGCISFDGWGLDAAFMSKLEGYISDSEVQLLRYRWSIISAQNPALKQMPEIEIAIRIMWIADVLIQRGIVCDKGQVSKARERVMNQLIEKVRTTEGARLSTRDIRGLLSPNVNPILSK